MRVLGPTKKLCILLAASMLWTAHCQTLAHKNWAGSGITVEPWWQGAVLYQIDPISFQDSGDDGYGDLQGIIKRLDYLEGLSVDALVLSPFPLQADFGRSASAPPFDPKYGAADDLDQLVQEATRRKMRLFVDLPLSASRSAQEQLSVARFWLSRGIAGLRLTAEPVDALHPATLTPAQTADRIRQLQRLCATFAGQRVLFSDLPPSTRDALTVAYRPRRRRPTTAPASTGLNAPQIPVQMMIDARLERMPHLDAASLRQALQPLGGHATPVPESDTPDRPRSFDRFGDGLHDIALAKLLATALLTSKGAPLLYFGQEIGMAAGASDPTPMQWGGENGFTSGVPWIEMGRNAAGANVALEEEDADSLLNWYRRLSALRHANPALRSGTMDLIAAANPDIVAWVRAVPAAISTTVPVLVVCNMTNRPLLVSLAPDVQRIGLATGSGMMHTLASSTLSAAAKDPVAGPVSLRSISLPPYGVYIGELPRQPGLESAPSPLRSRYAKPGSRATQ
jgi:hypothetical protein